MKGQDLCLNISLWVHVRNELREWGKGRSREASQEVRVGTQVRDGGGLARGAISGVVTSGWILHAFCR